MKNLLILAGGSTRNLAWGEACSTFFKNDFDSVYFMHYNHWQIEESNLDFERETKKIINLVRKNNGEWYIFAKSIGSILAIRAVIDRAIEPTQCVFFGMPLNLVAEPIFNNNWSVLEQFKVPTVAFHNVNDPTADYLFAAEIIPQFAKTIKVIEKQGDTHSYQDFNLYKDEIHDFIETV